jgi:DNA-binding beta-propeller fold protein YncE
MRRLRMAGTVVAGACAAALTVSLAACTPGSTSAGSGSPFATIFPSTAPAQPAGTSHAHATEIESGHPAGADRAGSGSVRAARLLREALADPDAIAAAGSDVWVANSAYEDGGRGWISEFSAVNGALIRVIAGPRYGLTDPQALAVDSGGIWVADGNGGGLTEFSATNGALLRVADGRRYQFADPGAIAAAGGDLWVANGASNTVTEVSAATGALIRVIDAPQYRLSTTVYSPSIAVAGGHVWVPDGNSDSVTEINAATGALIRIIDAPDYQFSGPDAIAAAGDGVWVVNVDSGSVTEINAATGALVRVISSVTNVPFAIAADQTSVWLMTNLGVKAVDGARPDGVVDELSAATGQPIARMAGPPFRSGNPGGAITADGARVWATDTNFYSHRGWVAELSARTGGLVRAIGARSGHLERS